MADDDRQFFDESEPDKSADGAGGSNGSWPTVTRRQFVVGAGGAAAAGAAVGVIGSLGISALLDDDAAPGETVATPPGGDPAAPGEPAPSYLGHIPAGVELDEAVVAMRINGQMRRFAVTPETTLAEALRETLHMTGTKVGCDRSECSACTVLVNGVAQNSCSLLAIREDGKEVWTIEGMERGGQLSPVQESFVQNMGLQCGYCTPGQIMQATALLLKNSSPTEAEIRREMAGNLCKCAAYPNIITSIQGAAERWNGWQL